ncbi:MAG: hypothetical protein FJ038_02385 [Chloroflexi bacterium]|nr:hypothetical protein [Chloroflexota bacterium]
MAIYRTQSRRPLILFGVASLLVGLVLGGVIGRLSSPDLAAQLAAARADVRPILTSLDVVRIEYDSLLTGGDSGSPGAIARAKEAFTARRATLALIDQDITARLAAALERVGSLVDAKAPRAELEAAIDDAEATAREFTGG